MHKATMLLRVAVIFCAAMLAGETFTPALGHEINAKASSKKAVSENSTSDTRTPAEAKRIIARRTREVVLALKHRDAPVLAACAHPSKGVRFSPYAYVNTETDRVMTRAQIKTAFTNRRRYVWGEYDGSGDPIRLTFGNYFKRFVYDRDFARAREIGYNEPLGHSTTISNIAEVYPKAIVVDYSFPNSSDNEMDWRTLRLVFEQQAGSWYLVGIAHDEWTI